jgi:glycosyltransferase involved in cell wall biosynthesis
MTSHEPGVLMVTGAYAPEISGAGLQCRELVRQARGAVRFTIWTTTTDSSLPRNDERDGVAVYRVVVDPASAWSKTRALLRFTRLMLSQRRNFSIVHLHGFSQKTMVVIVLGLLTGKRIAIKLTSVGHDDPASIRARGRVAYWCYSRARLFFGVSPRLEALYAASGLPARRFRLIPNGVDLERFRPASPDERRSLRAGLGLPVEGALILFVGFFSREKCPDLLFEAWCRLIEHGDRTSTLVMVGATRSAYYEVEARLADEIRVRAARRGLTARLHFVEATPEIERYQRAADVFVLPSVREGLPNALLEAMACGTGCIATRLDGVTDTLIDDGESGLLVPARDEAALTAALAQLVSQPERARAMGARARQRIERDFGLAQTASRYLAVYRELMAS